MSKRINELCKLLIFTAVFAMISPLLAQTASDGFDPNANALIQKVAVSTNGRIFAGGGFTSVGGATRNRLVGLETNGSLISTFLPDINGNVNAVAIQSNGKILIGGFLSQINGNSVSNIIRLNSDGTLDNSFNFSVNGQVDEILIQSDGKLLIRGTFTTVNGTSRPMLARLNADGITLDTTFAPIFSHTLPATPSVRRIFLQRDGKVLAGGNFDNVSGTVKQNIVRLNGNGTVDTAFTATANFQVNSFAEETGGIRLLIGGQFTNFNGVPFSGLVRVGSSTGNLATAFNPNVNGIPNIILQQADGKILLGGSITSVAGTTRNGLAKILVGGDVGIQDLTLSGGTLTWSLFYSGPQVHRLVFEKSADGINYTPLGEGTPNASGNTWQLNGAAFSGGYIRARGFYPDASNRQSTIEFVRFFVTKNKPIFDFDGDGKTDVAIFRPAPAEWWYLRSSDGGNRAFQFGQTSDKIVPADYTGDGKTDVAVWRPATGQWIILRSEDSSFYAFPFGANGDIPAPADYDGDGRADAAVFRPSNSTWFIQNSLGGVSIVPFGAAGDIPAVSDYDGDGKADIAIWRANGANGAEWWIQRSTAGLFAVQFGLSSDKIVPGDYTGDGKSDIAFWRPADGSWYILRSENNSFYAFPFGSNADLPAPGDFDGDGRMDAAVFRPASSTWFVLGSTSGISFQQFGTTGDRPVPNAFIN